jgi:peptide/nickel transport system substrate-binding protein
MIFLNDIDVMLDPNVRKAAAHAIDKQAIIDRLLSGYGVKIDTLETPEYAAYDPRSRCPTTRKRPSNCWPPRLWPDNPVKFKIQTTKGFKPKDYEMMQAIVGMWRKVGIEAEIEVYEIAKHYELRAADQLAPAAFYNWGNSVGDPTTSTGFAMFGPSPHSVWDGQDLIDMIGPLWGEAGRGQAHRRLEGGRPLHRRERAGDPAAAICAADPARSGRGGDAACQGALLPHLMKRA